MANTQNNTYSVICTVAPKEGLHSRPAAELAKSTVEYDMDFYLSRPDYKGNSREYKDAGRVLDILLLGATNEEDLVLTGEGAFSVDELKEGVYNIAEKIGPIKKEERDNSPNELETSSQSAH